MKYRLSQETTNEIRAAGRKEWITGLIKAIVFCSIAEILLFICSNFGDFFNRNNNPVLFWGLFVIIIVFFVFRFKLLNPIMHGFVRGIIINIENDIEINGAEKDVKGGWFATPSTDLKQIDVCSVIVQRENKNTEKYIFKRKMASTAREYYRKGDNVVCPQFAKYPFDCDRKMPQPFCINCGSFIDSDENKCTDCGITFSIEKTEQNMPEDQ